ncbi:hypothetical protein THRCLA_05884 [Thraustotheca clavata]|uniref:PPM-type phosphatase domain-containing protein n=1 Tax=Thraustotheca clavata TaxID=74557 RepID=A0A1V9ZRT2_9STRA|nr:hypothetical protein THRCLA_05884 [Thraustotheca clavata]
MEPATATASCRISYHATTDVGNLRRTNEDKFLIVPDLPINAQDIAISRALVAVFDGHGGPRAAEYLKTHFADYFVNDSLYGIDTRGALQSACCLIDAAFLKEAETLGPVNDGSTAIIVVIEQLRENNTMLLTTANIGDSRAVLYSNENPPKALSLDQTAGRDDEAKRVYASGGFVAYKNKYRAHASELSGISRSMRQLHESWMQSMGRPLRVYPGGVMCSRSIGDLNCKQANVLICEPEITRLDLTRDHTCLVVASDGVWSVVSPKKIDSRIRASLRTTKEEASQIQAVDVSETIVNLAKSQIESDDNITAAIALFHWIDDEQRGNTRQGNEDMYLIIPSLALTAIDYATHRSLVAVFDGHSGIRAAAFLHEFLESFLTQDPAYGVNISTALSSALTRLDKAFLENAKRLGSIIDGSTAVVVVLEQFQPDQAPLATCANLGDSRALLCSKTIYIELSKDHNATRSEEEIRAYDHGGFVAFHNTYRAIKSSLPRPIQWWRQVYDTWQSQIYHRPLRVYPGGVICTRVIGDLDCKQIGIVCSTPEIHQVKLSKDHHTIIVASDGLWAMVSNKLVNKIALKTSFSALTQALVHAAKSNQHSTDNITVVAIKLLWM